MTSVEFSGSTGPNEIARLEGLGFERVASSNFVLGGGLLVERCEDVQRLYTPFARIDNERVEAIRLSDTFLGRDANGICIQVLQRRFAEQAARWGSDKEFLELVPNGSGGEMRDEGGEGHATASLVDLSQKSLVDQLLESGFAQEATENEANIMRYRGTIGEMVAIVENNKLKGIFVPTDEMKAPRRNLGPQRLEVVGIEEFEGFIDSDTVQTGVRVSNGWAEFIIDPKYPSLPQQPRIVREPTTEELDIAPLTQVLEQGGFTQCGVNSNEVIRQLTAINNIPVSQLEADMQPARMSGAGFLGEGESLIDVLAHDNETVLANGLTHQELAEPFRYIQKLYERGMVVQTSGNQTAGVNDITINGHPYNIGVSQWRGIQSSPFRDGTSASYDLHILNLETGHAISVSALISEMIARYGFYEGIGTGYRTAPEDIIKTFSHLNGRVTDLSN